MKKSHRYLNKQIFFSFFTCLLVSLPNSVTASEEINLVHKQVIDAAEKFVSEKLQENLQGDLRVKASPIDKRIAIPECPSSFQISASNEALRQSNVTVRASCPDNSWYLFLMVKTVQTQQVVVLSNALSPGSVITHSNIKVVELDKKRIRSTTFSDPGAVIGAKLKRRLQPGQPLTPRTLCFVCKGDNILITADANGLSIKTSGIAQQDGNVGETILVQNTHSKKMLSAQVVNTNSVVVRI